MRKELLIPIACHGRIIGDDDRARPEVRPDELQRGEGERRPDWEWWWLV